MKLLVRYSRILRNLYSTAQYENDIDLERYFRIDCLGEKKNELSNESFMCFCFSKF